MITFKSVLGNIIDEVAKKFGMNKEQLGQVVERGIAKDTGADVGTILQETLSKLIKPQIVAGLDVIATIPPSLNVIIYPGYGSAQGKVHEIKTTQTVTIDNNLGIYYIVLNGSRVSVSASLGLGLPLAKIVIPVSGVTNKILDNKNPESDYDGYICSGKDLLFDNNFIIDDESLGQLKNVMSKIFAEYIFGTLRLSESLKIENTQGTMAADSQCIKFFNTNGDELAYYGGDEARVGNIKVTPTTVQSRDFSEGTHGFRLKDNGDAEFDNIEARGTIHASAGTIDGDLTVGGSLSSPNFTSGYSGNGWKIDGDGTATFNNGLFRGELHTSVFAKDEIHATNGTLVVTNATVIVSGLMSGDSSVYVKDPVFTTNDIVRMKTSDSTSEYMRITGGTNPYTLARDLDGTGANDFQAGDAIVSQQSRVELVATGDVAANLPYIDVIKRNSTVWNDTTTKVRLGNLAGITDANFGTLSDFGLYTNNGYFSGVLKAANFSGGTISGTNISGVNIFGLNLETVNISGGTISGTSINGGSISGLSFVGNNFSGGTISGTTVAASTFISNILKTANTGSRIELDVDGLRAYNSGNSQVAKITTSGVDNGDFLVGFKSGTSNDRYLFFDSSENLFNARTSDFKVGLVTATIDSDLSVGSLGLNTGGSHAIRLYNTTGGIFTIRKNAASGDGYPNALQILYSGTSGEPGTRDIEREVWNIDTLGQTRYWQNAVSGTVPLPHTYSWYKNYDWYPSANSPLIVDNYTSGYGALFRNNFNDPVYGMGAAAQFTVEGENAGNAMYVVNKGSSAIQFGIQLDNNSANGYGIFVHNISTGYGQQITQWSTGVGLAIQNLHPATSAIAAYKGINIYNGIATGGYGMQITNIAGSTGGTGIEIWNGVSGQGETVGLYVNNRSANYGVKIDQWDGDAGLYIYNQSVNPGIYSLTYSGTALQAQAVGASTLAFKAHGQGGTYGDMGLFTYGDGRCYAYANSSDPSLTIGQWGAGNDIQGTSTNWYITSAGNIWVAGNCSALTFTDRTPNFEGDALAEIVKIKSDNGEINHATLPPFARKTVKNEKTNKDEEARDLGAMISILVKGIQQITEKIDTLESQVKTLMEKIQ